MTNKKIRIGLVGGSPDRGWAKEAHVPAIKALPRFTIEAVSTSRQETADAAARIFGVPKAFGNWRDMVRDPDVDLVVACVRVSHHREIVLGAIAAGKDVFCEWPLGRTTTEAEEMMHAAKASGVRNIVGLQGQVAPAIVRIRDLIAEGLVGEVISVTLVSSLAMWGPELPVGEAFRLDRMNGATGLTITGGHSLDAVNFCFGQFQDLSAVVSTQHKRVKLAGTAATVDATSPDQAVICGTLKNGAVVSIHVKVDIANPTGVLLEVNGTEGDLIASTRPPVDRNAVGLQRADLRIFHGDRRRECQFTELEIPPSYRTVPVDVPPGSPLATAQLYACFARGVFEGVPIKPDFQSAVNCHRTIDAVQLAWDSGKRQVIEPGADMIGVAATTSRVWKAPS